MIDTIGLSLGSVIALFVGAIIAWAVMLLLQRGNTQNIEKLTAALRALGKGDFSGEVHSSSQGPLKELTRAFNETAHALEDSREKLLSEQRALEERMRERTRELSNLTARTNQLLQSDALTGLLNRSTFIRRLDDAIERSRNEASRCALLYVDLDFFKGFNSSMGHETGDAILRTVGERIKATLRPEDLIGRFGGDEFVVLLPRLDVLKAEGFASSIADEIQKALTLPLDVSDARINMPASIGVAIFPQDGRTGADLLKNADAAMHAAKGSGRNRIERFSDGNTQPIAQQSKLEAEIRRGIAAEEFFLVFQPQVDISTGSPVGVESLLRWRHPTRGLVSPVEFIPAAERSGLIHQLGQRALEMACEQFKLWQQNDIFPRMSVNVSAKQLEDPAWFDSVRDTIEHTKVPVQYLDLEITESMLVSNPERVVETLKQLARLGVSLTLDDFGTGYSSLSYLTQLPFGTIKIDKSFLHDVDVAARRSIVQAIVAVAHSLKMRVIAEGIESPMQLSVLREMQVEEGQGYYFSKPIEPSQVAAWWHDQLASVSSTMQRT